MTEGTPNSVTIRAAEDAEAGRVVECKDVEDMVRRLEGMSALREKIRGIVAGESAFGEASVAAATDAIMHEVEADRARLVEACYAYKDLLACYRLGKRPGEKLFARLEAADDALALVKDREPTTVTWVEGWNSEWTCSGCGRDWVLEAGTPSENEYFYCPGCGKSIERCEPYRLDDDDE